MVMRIIPIVLVILLAQGCATTVQELHETGVVYKGAVTGNYEALSRCVVRWLEHENPGSEIGSGIGRRVVHRSYPERNEEEIQGYAPNGFALFVLYIRPTKNIGSQVEILSVPYLLPYSSDKIIDLLKFGIEKCGSKG